MKQKIAGLNPLAAMAFRQNKLQPNIYFARGTVFSAKICV